MQHRGRPTAITPEIAKKIEALRDPALTNGALFRKCQAAGVKVAKRTLDRYLAGIGAAGELATMGAPGVAVTNDLGDDADMGDEGGDPGSEASARFAPERLMADLREDYLAAVGISNALKVVARLGGPEMRKWAEAVRAKGEIGERLARMAPPPVPNPDDDPAYTAAKERLLERAREIAAAAPK